jgi:hypothetical protein
MFVRTLPILFHLYLITKVYLLTLLCHHHIKLPTTADEKQAKLYVFQLSKTSSNFYIDKEIKKVWSYKYAETAIFALIRCYAAYVGSYRRFRTTC